MNFLAEEKSELVANTHTLWCERYRPNKLEDYVGNDTLKAKVKQYIETNDIPHLLLYGSAGTGKTTLAKLITNSIKCDMLYINASDENGIDTIRVKIKNFACNIGFNPLKVIILDEADYFTPAGQAGLRNVMETFSEHTRFILTCNYHERIIEPIVSRCQSFAITPPTKKDVAVSLSNILKKENVKFDKDGVVLLVNTHYPDIRAVINTAQRNVIDGTLTLAREDVLEGDIKAKMIEMLKDSNKKQAFTNIRQLLADNSVKSFADFYTVLFEKVDEYAPDNVADVIIIIADGQFQDASVVDKEICFMATIIKLLRATK
jgi:DNA polymerase III delta prime subunit